ncbi:LysR family transcriptional regulator [Kineococcus sp. T13]|uniref:LysR family transcriptional regulator n=1 Tax=Kineococcus vitellinus TaxID=2696565 RepID=UPI001411F87F|nr:LysR family transcriptional regulator [Kineococcus vitellinus]NAZ74046.1 LysR family transcriptional regulator [Kineococcus vitellinus]
MELRSLEHFVAVVDEGGFTRAAQRLRVAQPGVSAQVRNLERELGQRLFERTARGAVLTAAGEAALPHARAALAAAAAVREEVAQLSGLLRGSLRVGMLLSSSGMQLPAVLRAFRDRAPDVEVRLVEDDAAGLLEAVRCGDLDLAWVATADRDPPDLLCHPVAVEPLVALVAPGHPWGRRRTVALAELVGQPLLAVPRGGGMRTVLDEACAAAGLRARVEVEANSPVLLAALAAQGLGVALVPASFAAGLDAPGAPRALRVVRPALLGRVQVVWRPGPVLSPAARAFVALVRGWG